MILNKQPNKQNKKKTHKRVHIILVNFTETSILPEFLNTLPWINQLDSFSF